MPPTTTAITTGPTWWRSPAASGSPRVRERVELVAVLAQGLRGLLVGLVDDPADLRVDELLGSLSSFVCARDELAVLGHDRDRADGVAHSPAADHLAGDLSELAD